MHFKIIGKIYITWLMQQNVILGHWAREVCFDSPGATHGHIY